MIFDKELGMKQLQKHASLWFIVYPAHHYKIASFIVIYSSTHCSAVLDAK